MDDSKNKFAGLMAGPKLSDLVPKFHELTDFRLPKMRTMDQAIADANEAYTARALFEQLKSSIMQFENILDSEQEVGVRLVSFGQTLQFSVNRIGYMNPSLIWFDGVLPDGSTTKLIQHTSQISFLLIAMKRNNETPKNPIGFCAPQDDAE
jgi:hypothetical protein